LKQLRQHEMHVMDALAGDPVEDRGGIK